MRTHALCLLTLLLGCGPAGGSLGGDLPAGDDDQAADDDDLAVDDDDGVDDDDDADDDDAGDDDDTTPCEGLNPVPTSWVTHTGITSAEDFVFDLEGYVVSVDGQGNLVRSSQDGQTSLVVPGVVGDSAGISMLPGGDVVVADPWAGTLVVVSSEGSVQTLLSGLSYPNGVEVHRDGWIAVSEHDAGVVRRVDPVTGEFVVLGSGLVNPNGVTFSPDYETLYVNSFGGGTVHKIPLDGDGAAGPPELFASVGGPIEELPWGDDPWTESCEGLEDGDDCVLIDQPGTCTFFGEFGYCDAPDPFVAACEGAQEGDPCTLMTETGWCEGFPELFCSNPSWTGGWTEGGGLDGIAADACGNVYVTEYVVGRIWRWGPDGDGPDLVAELPAYWIPNMDFGVGVGGWDTTLLWVVERDGGNIHGLDIGVEGRPLAHL